MEPLLFYGGRCGAKSAPFGHPFRDFAEVKCQYGYRILKNGDFARVSGSGRDFFLNRSS